MKRLFLFALLLIACSSVQSQTIADIITARKSLKLRGNKVDSIGIDSISAYGSNNKLITEKAAKAFARSVSGGVSTDSAIVLKSVTHIATLSNPKVNSIFITDTLRGGAFFKYTGSEAADNGMIFSDAIGNKWARQVNDGKVNVMWYGARQNGIDCRSQVLAALQYIYGHPRMNTLYFPYDSVGVYPQSIYYISDSIVINQSVNILGDAHFKAPLSKIQAGNHKTLFIFKYDYGYSAIFNQVKDIWLVQSSELGVYNLNACGIKTSAQIKIDNVIIEAFDGDGLHISACATAPNGNNNNYGNSNLSSLIDLKASDCTNGVFIEGCDANKIMVYNLDVTGNRRWGVFDNGFLGNIYYSPHSGGNGTSTYSKTAVTYGGLYYAAIPGHDGYFQDAADSNYNKQPDLNVGTYWEVVPPMATTGAWSATTRYYSGGPYAIVNPNSWSTLYSPYTEGPNAPIWLNSRSKVDGGTPGAGVVNGAWWNMFSGYQYLNNSSLVVSNGRIGVGLDPTAPIHIKADAGNNGITAKFDGSAASLTYFDILSSSGRSYIGRNSGEFFIGNAGGNDLYLGNTSFYPNINNAVDIGKSSNKWKNFYAVQIFGDQISVGTTSTDASAIADIVSTTKGVLLPRMTTTQRTSIPSPTEGLEVYDLILHKKYVFDGTIWQACW